MATGVKYNTKEELLAAITALVYTNQTFAIGADDIQKSLKDLAESVWGQSLNPEIFVIDDDNYADYYGDYPGETDGHKYLTNIPPTTDIISIETTTVPLIDLCGIHNTLAPNNGKSIVIIGKPDEVDGSDGNVGFADTGIVPVQIGTFSAKLKYFLQQVITRGNYLEAYTPFMYWNNKWYSKGY